MSEERFSYIVERYFKRRGTFPVSLMFRNKQVDDGFLVRLDERIIDLFDERDDVNIVCTKIVEGEYWSGVLVELDSDEFKGVDSTSFEAVRESRTLTSKLREIYKEFDECDTSIIGFNTGSSVYPVSSLQSLGESYFREKSPSIR